MLTLERSTSTTGNVGTPLPTVWKALADVPVHFRRGQVHLVAAAPGVGKSVMALMLAMYAKEAGLYLSADTDQASMMMRSAAMLSGDQMETVERHFLEQDTGKYTGRFREMQHLSFSYDSYVGLSRIDAEIEAFTVVYGEYPRILVVDCLYNVDPEDGSDEMRALAIALEYLHEIARTTNAAVVVCHHLTGDYDDGTVSPPLSALRGKVSKVPEVVLTLSLAGSELDRIMRVNVVKNRGGPANPSGALCVQLPYKPSIMRLG